MDDDEVARILRELHDPEGPDVVPVGEIPSEALGHWPHRLTDRVVITRRQRAHYLEQHPEMAEFEDALVRTLLNPDQVHVATGPGDTAALFGRRDHHYDIVVIVNISTDASLANSVITARQQRTARKWSPVNRLRVVWER